MRILIHDYAGHPFQVQLSRTLAQRGYPVLHAYCASLQTTPRGSMHEQPDDPDDFDVTGITLSHPLEKYAYVKRWRQENEYGRRLLREVERFRPDVVLSGNTPLDAQRRLWNHCGTHGIRRVFWVQDLIGIATHRLLRDKIPLLGPLVGRYYRSLERQLLQQSDGIVLITDDFRPIMHDYNISDRRLHVIENWAPLDEVPLRPKQNPWAQAHDLDGTLCLLYAGTLGMKHNPEMLLALARHFADRDDVRVVVVSQGLGAEWLQEKKEALHLDNLSLLGFQPFEAFPDVLATADVLLAVLETDAGVFSVPSKVLTYLCAARPVLMAVPPENLAARIVATNEAGITVPPTDAEAFVQAADALAHDPQRRAILGRNARQYAEATFDIATITDAFERVLVD